jgi:hypothetical protein
MAFDPVEPRRQVGDRVLERLEPLVVHVLFASYPDRWKG